jgi:hypothetical protein
MTPCKHQRSHCIVCAYPPLVSSNSQRYAYAQSSSHSSFIPCRSNASSSSLQPQTLPNSPPVNLLILLPILPPHPCRIHIRRTLIIRVRKHAQHTNENLLYVEYRRPALRRVFVLHGVVAGRVENRDAHFAAWVDYTNGLAYLSLSLKRVGTYY